MPISRFLLRLIFFLPAPQPNSGLCRLRFRFTSIIRSRTVGRTPLTGDQLVTRPSLHVHKEKPSHNTTLNLHGLSGIRTHSPGVRTSEDSSCLRSLGYRDRLSILLSAENWRAKVYIFTQCENRKIKAQVPVTSTALQERLAFCFLSL
jgi:hypothetical protein